MSKSKATNAEPTETAQNLEQVRDILFGSQMRTLDRRLAQMDERVQRENETVRKELGQRLESLEAWSRKQVEKLDDNVKTERANRADELKTLKADVKKGLESLDRSLRRLDDATSTADSDLRDQVLGLTKSCSADIAALSERLTADLDRVAAELRFDKTDTASLVELFTDAARRLGESIDDPGAD